MYFHCKNWNFELEIFSDLFFVFFVKNPRNFTFFRKNWKLVWLKLFSAFIIEDTDDDSYEDYDSDEALDNVPSLDGDRFSTFSEEETKSKFTSYSMSSSVIRRNEQLTQLDDQFEKFMDQYDEDEVGALEMDDIGK